MGVNYTPYLHLPLRRARSDERDGNRGRGERGVVSESGGIQRRAFLKNRDSQDAKAAGSMARRDQRAILTRVGLTGGEEERGAHIYRGVCVGRGGGSSPISYINVLNANAVSSGISHLLGEEACL